MFLKIVSIYKKIFKKVLNSSQFFLLICKTVDSMCIHKPINTNIGAVMKNPAMLKFVPDRLKTKQMRNYVIRYVPDRYKNEKMCNKAILENGGALGLSLMDIRLKKCVIKLLIIRLMH